jgi:F0F1-type ATP synthase epsilon subunit
MPTHTLHFTVRTPHDVVLEIEARSIRIPTESGQAGLRPQNEPQIVAVEPGLLVVQTDANQTRFIGTAGGLLVTERARATLMTPLAVAGSDRDSIMKELQTALGEPNEEMQARAMLANLEDEILRELRRKPSGVAAREGNRA